MRAGRSIVFYAWAWLAVQALLLAGVVAFVVAGVSYRESAIRALHGGAQAAQIVNLEAKGTFLDTQRALRGFQATHQGRFLQTFYDGEVQYVVVLARLRKLAWRGVLHNVGAQARTALVAFRAGNQAVSIPAGSAQAARLYSRASASADAFVELNDQLAKQLAAASNAFATASGRTLGLGLAGTATVLALGVMVPVLLAGLALRWISRPLHDLTRMVRRRALGDFAVRAMPAGPADVKDLSASINFLADESDRLAALERERSRLQAEVHEASILIRQHLQPDAVIHEAVLAMRHRLPADSVWLGLADGGLLTLAEADPATAGQATGIATTLPGDSAAWAADLYQRGDIYRVDDLSHDDQREIPEAVLGALRQLGAASLVIAPFGAGAESLGVVALLRNNAARPWTGPELDAVRSLAGDIGRGLEHARLFQSEEKLVARLRALDRAKSSFLASSSHDLRTPLTSILGYIEILSDPQAAPAPPVRARMLDAVNRNVRRLKTLIEDMLTISMIELGTFTSKLQPMDLAALVLPAADAIRPSAAGKELGFDVRHPDHSLVINGDAGQLDRVLINVLSNAVKYTQPGGQVSLSVAHDSGWAVLTVTDTGIGIPQQDQQHLFSRFFRASNAVAQQIPGSGLGLSIVQTVISNHHGDVRLTSAEGHGTTVVIRLPMLGSEQVPGPGPEHVSASHGPWAIPQPAGPGHGAQPSNRNPLDGTPAPRFTGLAP